MLNTDTRDSVCLRGQATRLATRWQVHSSTAIIHQKSWKTDAAQPVSELGSTKDTPQTERSTDRFVLSACRKPSKRTVKQLIFYANNVKAFRPHNIASCCVEPDRVFFCQHPQRRHRNTCFELNGVLYHRCRRKTRAVHAESPSCTQARRHAYRGRHSGRPVSRLPSLPEQPLSTVHQPAWLGFVSTVLQSPQRNRNDSS